VGTLALDDSKNQQSLFQIGEDIGVKTLRTGLGLSNGIDWSPSGDRIYHVDTLSSVVWSARYEVGSGLVGRWKVQFEVRDGFPDGLTVDAAGHLWIAIWGAGQVRQYSPTGGLETVVEVDAPNTTCSAFVGPELDILAITTARDELSPSQLERYPMSGALFLAATAATGLRSRRWAGDKTAPAWPEPPLLPGGTG
jgi:sugar lactone lactonase YvrE